MRALIAAAVPHETALVEGALRDLEVAEAGPWRTARGALAGEDRPGPLEVEVVTAGVGPSNAAAAVAWAATRGPRPDLVVSVGSAGSYDLDALPLKAVALVEAECFGDLGTETDDGAWTPGGALGLGPLGREDWVPLSVPEVDAAAFAFPVRPARGLTVHHVTGSDALGQARHARTGALVESMEGAAVALVGHRLGIPCWEVRGVSNLAGRRDRGAWQVKPAGRHAQEVLLAALARWAGLSAGAPADLEAGAGGDPGRGADP